MRRKPLIGAIGLAALLLALAAAGCGGSKPAASETAVQWANGVCGAVSTWKTQVTKLAGSIRVNGLSEQSLQTTASSIEAATRTMANTLKSLGPPKTDSGTKAKQSVDTLAKQLSESAAAIKTALDSGTIAEAATTIATSFASMQATAKQTVTTLQSLDTKGELGDAFEQAEKCSEFTGSA
jgi:hypothetical protein